MLASRLRAIARRALLQRPAGHALLGLILTSCAVTEPPPLRVTLSGHLERFHLSVADTLVIQRTIRNLDQRAVWLDVSSLTPPAFVTTVRGEPACHLGLTTAELSLQRIPPESTVEVVQQRPLGRLQNCGPGEYRVVVTALLYPTEYGPPDPGLLLESQPLALVVVAPYEPPGR